MSDADPVSWLMIERGLAVVGRDGGDLGRVAEVVGDSGSDIFNGLSVSHGLLRSKRYVPSERVGTIVEGRVELDLDAGTAVVVSNADALGASTFARLREHARDAGGVVLVDPGDAVLDAVGVERRGLQQGTRSAGCDSANVVKPRTSLNMTVLSSSTPPSRRCSSVLVSTWSTTSAGTKRAKMSRTRWRSIAAVT